MKTIFAVFIFFIFFISYKNSFASHGDPVNGFYVNKNGDTVYGSFPKKIPRGTAVFKFQPTGGSAIMNISFDTCIAVSCGEVLYKKWYGTRSMAYIDKFTLDIVNLDNYETGIITLERVFQGESLGLYYFRDVRDHFFIEKDGYIDELAISYRYTTDSEKLQYPINPPTYFINPVYRAQLISLMGDKLSKKKKLLVESCEFNLLSLTRLLKKIDPAPKK